MFHTVWAAMWPNIFAPSAWTLVGIAASHAALKRHLHRHTEEIKQHITTATTPTTEGSAQVSNVAPVIVSASYDQSSYLPGATMTLTIDYTQGQSAQVTNTTVQGVDTVNGLPASLSVSLSVQEPDGALAWTITDAKSRVYTEVAGSDTGSQVKFTAVA